MAYGRSMDELRAELDLLERRYGRMDRIEEVDRIRNAISRHRFELDRLNAEIDALTRRRRVSVESIEKLTQLERVVLQDAISGERRRQGEAWSPIPILAFRAWLLKDGVLHGAIQAWFEPTLEATCDEAIGPDEVPHTDGRCDLPACGIYALKRAKDLKPVTGWPVSRMAVGMVALTGKVVEHELGYRAQRAEIVALAVPVGEQVIFTTEPSSIEAILNGRSGSLGAETGYCEAGIHDSMCRWLEAQKERQSEWT